jgi:hypothetical protein
VPLLLGLHFLIVLQQYQIKSYDYVSYEMGARAVVEGGHLYGNDSQQYLYWPLLAQVMGGAYAVMAWASTLAGGVIDDSETIWRLIFYFYSCIQYLLLIAAYFLCYRLATQLRVEKATAAMLIGVLFLFNNSLYATLHYNQMGLMLLCVSLGAILLLKSSPIVSGILVAFGGHIKLYPYILLLPWTLKRHWRAIIAVGVASIAIVFVQTRAFQDWGVWQEYLVFARQWVDSSFFRENSLQNIVHNTVRQTGYLLGVDTRGFQPFASLLVVIAQAAMLAWYLWRFFVREKACKQATASATSAEAREFYTTVTMYGHSVEVLAFALILSPIVWEHHYLLALPIAVWAVATQGRQRPWLIALAIILMMGLPTFNVYPFSYHRIFGLLLLLVTMPPGVLPSTSEPALDFLAARAA